MFELVPFRQQLSQLRRTRWEIMIVRDPTGPVDNSMLGVSHRFELSPSIARKRLLCPFPQFSRQFWVRARLAIRFRQNSHRLIKFPVHDACLVPGSGPQHVVASFVRLNHLDSLHKAPQIHDCLRAKAQI